MADADRFEIIDLLGRGGMGAVYRARDRQTGQYVAIKEIHPTFAEDEVYVRRLEREVEVARRITSPNVVRVLGYGKRGNIPFMVMEYVEGETLRQLLDRKGRLSWAELRPILMQAAEGLRAAHRVGVVHRDVKPSNILITRDGTVKLADFGIARAGDLTQLTGPATLLGTPAYMAPENSPSPQSDLYALGCVAFELLSGRPPFEGESQQAVLLRHMKEAPNLSELPIEARRLVGGLLQKNPQRRPKSATAVLVDLEAQLRDTPGTLVDDGKGSGSSGGTRSAVASRGASGSGVQLSRRTLAILAVAAGVIVLLALVALLARGGGGDNTTKAVSVITPGSGTLVPSNGTGTAKSDARILGSWESNSTKDGTTLTWDAGYTSDGKYTQDILFEEHGTFEDPHNGSLTLRPEGGTLRIALWNPKGDVSDLVYGAEPVGLLQFGIVARGPISGGQGYGQYTWKRTASAADGDTWSTTENYGAYAFDLALKLGADRSYSVRAVAKDAGNWTASNGKYRLVSATTGINDGDYEFLSNDQVVTSVTNNGITSQFVWKRRAK